MQREPQRTVEWRVDDGVGVLTLADPDHRNALSRQVSDDLAMAVDTALETGARSMVLTATPPVFCAGGSLEGLLDRSTPLADSYRGLEALDAAPVPTIAAVGGPAIGAGVTLALACDVVLVSPDATFDPRFLDLGIHPGGAHLWRLAGRIGTQGAAALVLCGDVLTGTEAAERGLAWRCVAADELEPLARRLARRAAGRHPELVARTKETLRATAALADREAAAAVELAAQEWSVGRPGFAEAVRAMQARVAARRRA